METTVRQELEMFYRMSGVFIQMLMYEAEQRNTTLRADVNYMENYKALEEIKDFESLSLKATGDFSLKKKANVGSKLPTLGSAMMMTAQENSESAELRAENDRVKKMVQQLQEKLAQTLAGKSMMSEKAEGAIKDTNQMVEELRAKVERLTEEKEKAMEINENLRKETLSAKQEMQKKVNEMTQVNNMKKMI